MNELAVYKQTVELAPLEDVAKFMLIAPEKAKAQAAEIRAMKNLGVAQEVLAQKETEQRMLNELILDAGARIGELTREIPKAKGNQYTAKVHCDSGDTKQKQKTKEQIGAELGFSRHDMSRFEKLADNRDLIEEEKALAREEHRQPTRTNVLEAASVRDKQKREGNWATRETREQYNKIDQIAHQVGTEVIKTTFDDVMRLLDIIEDDFIAKVERTIEGERAKLSADERWPDAIDGYFDGVIADIDNMKRRILK